MQLTMNSASHSVSIGSKIAAWFNNTARKLTTVFTAKKKSTVTIEKEVAEAIRFVEWRTRYDQQRIARYVYTRSFQKDNTNLYNALGMNLPVKFRCLEIDVDINIQKTDSSFERRLLRIFGSLRPETKILLEGGTTKNQRWAKRNARIMERYLDVIPEMLGKSKSPSLKEYEQQMLSALIAPTAIVHIPQIAPALLPETVQSVASIEPEKEMIEVAIEEVVVETLPIEETIQQPIEVAQTVKTTKKKAEKKPAKKKIFVKTEKKTKELAHCTIPEMKAFAKRKGFPVPGQITVKDDIQAYITERFNELNNSN